MASAICCIKSCQLLERNKYRLEACVLGKMDEADSKHQLSMHELNIGTKATTICADIESKLIFIFILFLQYIN